MSELWQLAKGGAQSRIEKGLRLPWAGRGGRAVEHAAAGADDWLKPPVLNVARPAPGQRLPGQAPTFAEAKAASRAQRAQEASEIARRRNWRVQQANTAQAGNTTAAQGSGYTGPGGQRSKRQSARYYEQVRARQPRAAKTYSSPGYSTMAERRAAWE